VFACAWMPIFGLVAWLLVQEGLPLPRAALALLVLVVFVALFGWLTLRGALAPDDFAPGPEHARVVRRRMLVLAVMAVLVMTLTWLAPGLGAWWLAMHVIVAAGLSLPLPQAVAWTAALVGITITSAWLATGGFDATLLTLAAFGASAMAVRQLTISVGQLRLAREELARLAVAEERVRFARDLHDLLGHTLSLVVLKSELAGRLLPKAPDRAAAEIHDVEVAARDALRQVRDAVAGYRQPTLRAELDAAREVLSAAGIGVRVEHTTSVLPATVDALLAWAVREGVTNVVRHSRARSCTIRLCLIDANARVEIIDDGHGVSCVAAPGSGLVGLAERAAARGGWMRAAPAPDGGFSLVVEAPVDASSTARSM
jgi:two-component system, NarL family, sensor histidine kinase DesK